MSTFSGMNIAVGALKAQQYAMNITGHNIANANTEGYRRQEPVFVSGNPLTTSPGNPLQIGTGVQTASVRRIQTDFLDTQIRSATQQTGKWSTKSNALQQVETVLGEPKDSGLGAMMENFWNSWDALASSPESLGARISTVQSGTALADRIKGLHYGLTDVRIQADSTIVDKVSEVNRLASEIVDLNKQIAISSASGNMPNDLLDNRDLLVEQMSKIIQIDVHTAPGSEMSISIGGKTIVQGIYHNNIVTAKGDNGSNILRWSDDNSPVTVTGGEIKGLTDIRDVIIPGYLQSLDEITKSLVSRVNSIHSGGYGLNGRTGDFFTEGSDASNISVRADLISSPAGVAASNTKNIGDNSVAIAINAVRDEKLFEDGTIADKYGKLVTTIGGDSRDAAQKTTLHEACSSQMKTQRDSISGVSLDEEMTNIIKYQKSYSAAARVVTVMDEMIETLVSRMGVVGR